MTEYRIETVAQCIDEIKPLNAAHWEELASHKETRPLDPDYDKYYQLEGLGMIRIMTCRQDGVLIGYYISMLCPHMHYQTCVTALNDILYIHPDYRKSTIGYRLIAKAISDLKNNTDTNIVIIHMKITHPFRELLNHFGFHKTEENWELQI